METYKILTEEKATNLTYETVIEYINSATEFKLKSTKIINDRKNYVYSATTCGQTFIDEGSCYKEVKNALQDQIKKQISKMSETEFENKKKSFIYNYKCGCFFDGNWPASICKIIYGSQHFVGKSWSKKTAEKKATAIAIMSITRFMNCSDSANITKPFIEKEPSSSRENIEKKVNYVENLNEDKSVSINEKISSSLTLAIDNLNENPTDITNNKSSGEYKSISQHLNKNEIDKNRWNSLENINMSSALAPALRTSHPNLVSSDHISILQVSNEKRKTEKIDSQKAAGEAVRNLMQESECTENINKEPINEMYLKYNAVINYIKNSAKNINFIKIKQSTNMSMFMYSTICCEQKFVEEGNCDEIVKDLLRKKIQNQIGKISQEEYENKVKHFIYSYESDVQGNGNTIFICKVQVDGKEFFGKSNWNKNMAKVKVTSIAMMNLICSTVSSDNSSNRKPIRKIKNLSQINKSTENLSAEHSIINHDKIQSEKKSISDDSSLKTKKSIETESFHIETLTEVPSQEANSGIKNNNDDPTKLENITFVKDLVDNNSDGSMDSSKLVMHDNVAKEHKMDERKTHDRIISHLCEDYLPSSDISKVTKMSFDLDPLDRNHGENDKNIIFTDPNCTLEKVNHSGKASLTTSLLDKNFRQEFNDSKKFEKDEVTKVLNKTEIVTIQSKEVETSQQLWEANTPRLNYEVVVDYINNAIEFKLLEEKLLNSKKVHVYSATVCGQTFIGEGDSYKKVKIFLQNHIKSQISKVSKTEFESKQRHFLYNFHREHSSTRISPVFICKIKFDDHEFIGKSRTKETAEKKAIATVLMSIARTIQNLTKSNFVGTIVSGNSNLAINDNVHKEQKMDKQASPDGIIAEISKDCPPSSDTSKVAKTNFALGSLSVINNNNDDQNLITAESSNSTSQQINSQSTTKSILAEKLKGFDLIKVENHEFIVPNEKKLEYASVIEYIYRTITIKMLYKVNLSNPPMYMYSATVYGQIFYKKASNLRDAFNDIKEQIRIRLSNITQNGFENEMETFVYSYNIEQSKEMALIVCKIQFGENFFIGKSFNKETAKITATAVALMALTEPKKLNDHSNKPNPIDSLSLKTYSSHESRIEYLKQLDPQIQFCTNSLNSTGSENFNFTTFIILNGDSFYGHGKNKKASEKAAVQSAFTKLSKTSAAFLTSPEIFDSFVNHVEKMPQELVDYIGELVRKKYAIFNPNPKKRDVIAGIVQTTGYLKSEAKLIALATGTKCISGINLELNGGTVNDTHAEIVARRCLLLYFYAQLENIKQKGGCNDSIFEPRMTGCGYQLKANIKFHLFINIVPCGDAAVVYQKDRNRNYGQLKMKIESIDGSRPYKSNQSLQSWDAILQGNPLLTMSCSDKISKWNVVGVQGTLLSNFIDPIYLDSIIIGTEYDLEPLRRATYQRIESISENLNPPFKLNKPQIHLLTSVEKRLALFAPEYSCNWVITSPLVEKIESRTGKPSEGKSRLCKTSFVSKYLAIIGNLSTIQYKSVPIKGDTYKNLKETAVDYKKAKELLYTTFQRNNLNCWIKKPIEVNDFELF